jgi:hypothetical protein
MSVEALALALNHSQASGTAKVVMLGIANHDNDRGSFPSQSTLAVYANVSESNVKTAIDKLVKLGEIEVDKRAGGYADTPLHERSNRYVIKLVCPPQCDRTTAHRILCAVCGKKVPNTRRTAGTHTVCQRRALSAPVVPRPGIAGDPPLNPTGGYSDTPRGDRPQANNHSLNPTTKTPTTSYVPDRARDVDDVEVDEATRWALECPARWDSRGSGHVEGHHGRCAECHQLVVRTDEGLRLQSAESGDAADARGVLA